MRRRMTFLGIIFMAALFLGAGIQMVEGYEGPLSKKVIESYSNVAFKVENFSQVEKGMSQEQVLQLLGTPVRIREERRKHNRWTVHYFYPDGHVVNFKNGMVVGKE